MVWFISNTLNNKFQFLDSHQFMFFAKAVEILVRHPSEQNLIEVIWSLRYLMGRESSKLERIECVMKTNFVGILTKEIIQQVDQGETPRWMDHAIEALRYYFAKAGSAFCAPNLLEVNANNQALMKAYSEMSFPNRTCETVLIFIKTLTSDENLDSQVLHTILKNMHRIVNCCTEDRTTEIKTLTLEALYNILASIDKDSCRGFVKNHVHVAQLFLSMLVYTEEHPELTYNALECLQLLLSLGNEAADYSEMAETNQVTDYCLSLPVFDLLEEVQKASNSRVKKLANEVINCYFT
jgi:hypothetical protein